MLQTAAGLSMAGPMFVMGIDLLRSGQTAGGVAFFVLGGIALYLPTYVIRRIGGPRTWVRRRLGGGRSDPEPDADSDPDEGDSTPGSGSSPAGLVDRFRRR